jgi:hypothetical protein
MIHFPILMTIRRKITYDTGEGEGTHFISLPIASGPASRASTLAPFTQDIEFKIMADAQGQCQERRTKGWDKSTMLQQHRDVSVRGVHIILRRSSLSATKAPQCERVINGLAMMH